MSTQILIKRSSVASAVPTTSDIATGELAVNTVDKRIFTNNNGTIVELGTYPSTQAVAGNATVGGTLGVTGATTLSSGSVTGNFSVAGTLTVASPVNSTDAASKGYVDAQVSAVIDAAPAALDTLNELAAALNDDANFATTVTNALNTKLNKAGDTMTGTLVMGANKVTSTATPTAADDLTRKGYVDGLYQSTVDAEVSAANALASEQAAATSASNAATSASASATSASAASTSATNAASSATAAASSATSAANSATASATSATQSAASATQAQALVDSIESFYLGAEASAPTVDDNGDPLQAGDWYFNTTDNTTYIYNGSSWQSVSPDLVADLTPQLGGNLDTNGNDINFGDNDKVTFGAGSDLQIYHTGTQSYISDVGTGNLNITATDFYLLDGTNSEYMLTAQANGAVGLRYDGVQKLATTSTGIDVTGTATMDGLTVEMTSGYARIQDANTTVVDGTDMGGVEWRTADVNVSGANRITASISAQGDGTFDGTEKAPTKLVFSTHASSGVSPVKRMDIDSGGDISFYEDTGTTAKFYWDASAESLGIGTSSPSGKLTVYGGETQWGATSSLGFLGYTGGSPIVGSLGALPLLFYTNAAERMRIDSAGNVGIGTASPDAKLDVRIGSTSGKIAEFHNDTGYGIDIGSSISEAYVSSGFNQAFLFKTNSGGGQTERMRLDSSGNLLVGTTDSTIAVNTTGEGIALNDGNRIEIARDSFAPLRLNRTGTDGEIIELRKAGTTVGSIGTRAGYVTIGKGDVGLLFQDANNRIEPNNQDGLVGSDGVIDLGSSSTRFKDLYLSGGVYLGGTGAANHLDDYETGTWTATVGCTGNGTTTTTKTGFYTKVGNLVTATFRNLNNIDTTGLSGLLTVSLPFACKTADIGVAGNVEFAAFTYPTGKTSFYSFASNGGSSVLLGKSGTGAAVEYMVPSDITSGVTDIAVLTITYQTDS